jgi:hypothetical protein
LNNGLKESKLRLKESKLRLKESKLSVRESKLSLKKILENCAVWDGGEGSDVQVIAPGEDKRINWIQKPTKKERYGAPYN